MEDRPERPSVKNQPRCIELVTRKIDGRFTFSDADLRHAFSMAISTRAFRIESGDRHAGAMPVRALAPDVLFLTRTDYKTANAG